MKRKMTAARSTPLLMASCCWPPELLTEPGNIPSPPLPLGLGHTGGVGAADADADEETEDVWGIMAGTWLQGTNELLALLPVPCFDLGWLMSAADDKEKRREETTTTTTGHEKRKTERRAGKNGHSGI